MEGGYSLRSLGGFNIDQELVKINFAVVVDIVFVETFNNGDVGIFRKSRVALIGKCVVNSNGTTDLS